MCALFWLIPSAQKPDVLVSCYLHYRIHRLRTFFSGFLPLLPPVARNTPTRRFKIVGRTILHTGPGIFLFYIGVVGFIPAFPRLTIHMAQPMETIATSLAPHNETQTEDTFALQDDESRVPPGNNDEWQAMVPSEWQGYPRLRDGHEELPGMFMMPSGIQCDFCTTEAIGICSRCSSSLCYGHAEWAVHRFQCVPMDMGSNKVPLYSTNNVVSCSCVGETLRWVEPVDGSEPMGWSFHPPDNPMLPENKMVFGNLILSDLAVLHKYWDVNHARYNKPEWTTKERMYLLDRYYGNLRILVWYGARFDNERLAPFENVSGWFPSDMERARGIRSAVDLLKPTETLGMLIWGSPHRGASTADFSDRAGPEFDNHKHKTNAFSALLWQTKGIVMMTFASKYDVQFDHPRKDERLADRVLLVCKGYFRWYRPLAGNPEGIFPIDLNWGGIGGGCVMIAIAYPPEFHDCIAFRHPKKNGLDVARTYLNLLMALPLNNKAVVLGGFNFDLEGELARYLEEKVDGVYRAGRYAT